VIDKKGHKDTLRVRVEAKDAAALRVRRSGNLRYRATETCGKRT
jgi:hypothetical protein